MGTILAAIFGTPLAALVFLLRSTSHWILDAVAHLPDLPIMGFGKRDRKVDLGLWRHDHMAFVADFLFYAGVTMAVLPGRLVPGALVLCGILHQVNVNSFFGFTRKKSFRDSTFLCSPDPGRLWTLYLLCIRQRDIRGNYQRDKILCAFMFFALVSASTQRA